MTHAQKRLFLIEYLISESGLSAQIPADEESQKRLLRALFNVRMPRKASERFLQIQNEYLQEESEQKGITDIADLLPTTDRLYLWQGDITTLKIDAIVNAANAQMLGCFCPNHGCIDNAIHTFAGIRLRQECNEKMQGRTAKNGEVLITSAYNLPSKYVFHTIGPVVSNKITEQNRTDLKNCYINCLKKADEKNIESIAFCCISTGVFGYPNEPAALLATNTVKEYLNREKSKLKIVFNVFTDKDYDIYRRLL